MRKFYIHTMGCKSNQFESAIIEENLQKNKMCKTKNIDEANIYILNSCTVTHKSDGEALYLLRNVKHRNPQCLTVLTGCLAQIEKAELLKHDFVDYVIGNDEKLDLFNHIEANERLHMSDIMEKSEFNKTVLLDMSKTRASLKIQDGCDNRCSYCIIPFARGKSRSADIDFIVEQINNFSQNGFKEVVLTGIHIGQWGTDLGLELLDLLKEIETRTTIERYRLGSLNPLEINDEMLNFLKTSNKFCPHFHLSLQSACNKTLKSMNRFYTVEDYLELIEKINTIFDLPFLGSDIIAGFAGEDEDDFDITYKNLEKSGLTQIHTFPYSIRSGTVGARSALQLDDKTKEARAIQIRKISSNKYGEFLQKNIERTVEVLVEKNLCKKTGQLKGMTRNYVTVYLNSTDIMLSNTLQMAKVVKIDDGKLFAELI
ncbi:MAG: tRNA (N(6)-L-threonylcarbamoyladenosine(37)-C(2))-methylthiotransferase MtaB [Candidatus Gastranaerophilales bacterium]